MCGRYTNITPVEAFGSLFRIAEVPLPELKPRFNVAPGQDVLACRAAPKGGARQLVMLRWGLVPHWAKDLSTGYRMINARAETVAEKPSFRSAFRSRRCLVAADGFYEWKIREGSKAKQPHRIRLKGERPFGFAGLWERWPGREGEVVESCTIIVTTANDLLAPIHERMPVILPPGAYDLWLDPQVTEADRLLPLLRPYPQEEMETYPVSTQVNSPANDGPALVEPV